MKRFLRQHPGVTLVELLLFLSLMAVASGAVFGFFILTADARVRQRARADAQQVAVQLQQSLTYEIRGAERILLPARGNTGTVLVLQSASAGTSPVVLSAISGSLLMVRGPNSFILSPSNITVDALAVENVSFSDDRPLVRLGIRLHRRLELPTAEEIVHVLDLTIASLPTDTPTGDACGCAAPSCSDAVLQWDACPSGTCTSMAAMAIPCP